MPFNGSGTFNVFTPGNPISNGQTSDAVLFNNTISDLASGLSNTLTKDGQGVPTSNLPMGGYKLTGLSAGAVNGDSVRFEQLPSGSNPLAIGSGGTGATTAAAALAALNGMPNDSSTTVSTAGGTADAITATFSPNVTTLTKGLRVVLKDCSANTVVNPTFAAGTTSATTIVKGNNLPLVAGDILGDADLDYSTTYGKWVLLNPAKGVSPQTVAQSTVQGLFKNLQLSSTGTSASVAISSDEIVVEDASNSYVTLRSLSLTVNSAGSGANGLDTGTLAASTWYSVWVIYNGTTSAGLISLSTTAPTMPSGYTFKARIGWIRTDASGNKYPLSFKQYGKRAQYVVASGSNVATLPQMATGTAGSVGTPTFVSISTSSYIPTTSSTIMLTIGVTSAGNIAIAGPNNAYGSSTSTNPPPIQGSFNASTTSYGAGAFCVESSNIYWACSGSGFVNCLGWEDNF